MSYPCKPIARRCLLLLHYSMVNIIWGQIPIVSNIRENYALTPITLMICFISLPAGTTDINSHFIH
jgi:hypothetical protein